MIEEVLYIAMEDFVIDMVMPEGGSVRIPINPFTLIGATTKSEMLSQPMKNRFVYSFHFMEYTFEEKQIIIERYLDFYQIPFESDILQAIAHKVDSVPREIHTICIKIRDFCVNHGYSKLTNEIWLEFLHHSQIKEG